MTLANLKEGETGRITGLLRSDDITLRLAELGLLEGQHVLVLKRAPLGDPVAVRIMDYELCLRRTEAAGIQIERAQSGPA